MTNEEKELLLKDLTARLPYGVIVEYGCKHEGKDLGERKSKLTGRMIDSFFGSMQIGMSEVYSLQPYLRPMSSMTEDEKLHIVDLEFKIERRDNFYIAYYDFLNSIHIDYRGLISKGLAIKAPEKMYKEYRLPPLGSNWWEMYNSINLKNE